MSRRTAWWTLIAILLLSLTNAAQGFDYSKYKPRTLAELVQLNSSPAIDPKVGFYFSGDWFYSQVRLTFVGTARPISAVRKDVLARWKTTFNVSDENVALFEQEFLFKECDKEVWLPVQKQVASFFSKELKTGDMITLYIILAGGRRDPAGKWDFVFLVNEFDK